VIPPLITPLAGADRLDEPGLAKLIEHVLGGGVHGLFLLGTTGEGPGLSVQLKYELVKQSCQLIGGRVPVLVGISDTSFAESIKLAEHAAGCGADAVVLAPPYYFPAGQAELLEYLGHISPRLPLPLFLYNMPAMTKIDIAADTVLRAADIPNLVGLKDSSGNMVRFHEYIRILRTRPEFSLLMGPEELLAESVMFGGHGGVAGGANLHPRLFVDLYEAAERRDLERVLVLQDELYRLRRLYSCGKYASTFIKGVKCALSLLGICNDFMAEPFHSFRAPERDQIRQLLVEMEMLPRD
jgi:4-hydroxy-tetrahydrodipicolinate synthase